MKILSLLLIALTLSLSSFAGFEGLNQGASLKIFNRVNCSTGMTCTRGKNGLFTMVSSPSLVGPLTLENGEIINNTVDDTVEVLSNDDHTTLKVTGFEAKDAILFLYSDQGDDAADKFSLKASAADVLSLNNNGTAFLSFDSSGNATGAGTNSLSGFISKVVAATATTITASQCGSTFQNSGAVQMELPEASVVIGCRLTFITANASNFDLNPDNGDQILVQTNAAGDATRNATLGNSITLQAISASQWAPVSVQGTWSDIN